MATESLQLSETFPAPPERVWRAWLDSKEHTEMTGAETSIQPAVGATFQASDGYIVGMNVELEPYRRIVQTWRTSEFPPGSPHSRLEIVLDAAADGTRLTLNHSEIPEGQADRYREGWRDYYFMPMKDYFLAHEHKPANEVVQAATVPSFESQPVEPSIERAPLKAALGAHKNGTPIAAPVKKAVAKAASPAKAKPAAPARASAASATKASAPATKPAPAARAASASKVSPAKKAAAATKTTTKAAPAKKAAASTKAAGAKKAAAAKKSTAGKKPASSKAKASAKAASSVKAKASAKKAAAKSAGAKKTAGKAAAGKKAAAKSKRR